jgi:hypothetical protein
MQLSQDIIDEQQADQPQTQQVTDRVQYSKPESSNPTSRVPSKERGDRSSTLRQTGSAIASVLGDSMK